MTTSTRNLEAFSSTETASGRRDTRPELGDIPVFDGHRERVGFIPVTDLNKGRSDAQRSNKLLSHCMNSSITWLPSVSIRKDTERLRAARFLRRIPLVDEMNQLCGIVVADGDAKVARSRVSVSNEIRAARAVTPPQIMKS